MKEIFVVDKAQKKFWGSNGIRTHDLRDTGAMLYRLSLWSLAGSRSGVSSIYTHYMKRMTWSVYDKDHMSELQIKNRSSHKAALRSSCPFDPTKKILQFEHHHACKHFKCNSPTLYHYHCRQGKSSETSPYTWHSSAFIIQCNHFIPKQNIQILLTLAHTFLIYSLGETGCQSRMSQKCDQLIYSLFSSAECFSSAIEEKMWTDQRRDKSGQEKEMRDPLVQLLTLLVLWAICKELKQQECYTACPKMCAVKDK